MARTEALLWWPAVAEVLVLSCAVALTCGEHNARIESSVIDTRQVGVPDELAVQAEASDRKTADDDAADDDATDGDPADGDPADGDPADTTDDAATDEEATEGVASDADVETDTPSAESMDANARAAGALRDAERYESKENYLECAQELAPIKWRLSMVDNAELSDAVETTFNRCDEALAHQYEQVKPTDCPFEVEGAIAVTAAPSRLAPRTAKGACLALMPGSARTQQADPNEIVCPHIALVWSAGGLHRRALASVGGPLHDELWCCKLESIAAGTLDGKTMVRVSASGHPCGGGTAYQATDALYEWNGKSLASPIDISIGYH